jgi:DNA processing protein
MEITDDLAAWVVLSRTPGINTQVLERALLMAGGADAQGLPAAGSIAALVRLSAASLASLGFGAAARRALAEGGGLTPAEITWLEQPAHRLVRFTDAAYPPLLRAVTGFPILLYVAGDAQRLADPQLAIVGSRNPTGAGTDNAFAFAQHLALSGLTITSGLAEGIDAAAHRGALAAPGTTLAVLGTGIDLIYPSMHEELALQIQERGALVSEFPLGTPGRAANFPQRNRIIAGLSLGTLVIEAARRSGSLITARLAGEAGREVFALPGSIHNPLARGSHQLIREGAWLTENAADILSELNFSSLDGDASGARKQPAATPKSKPMMDKAQKILLDALGFEPSDPDVLVRRTGFKPEEVSSMMLILELEGHVRSAHGGRYTRVARSPKR